MGFLFFFSFKPLVSSSPFCFQSSPSPSPPVTVLASLLQSASPQPPAPCLWNTVTPQVLGTPFEALPGWVPWDLIIAPCTFLSSQLQAIEEGLGKSTLLNAYK